MIGPNMNCPFCNNRDSRVLESRLTSENSSIRRRRECEVCQKRFTTYERIEAMQLLVVKSSGNREPYTREKVRAGVARACAKTSVTANQVDELVDDLEVELTGRREISSRMIGELTLSRLKGLNQVAYVRFASVYRAFQSVSDFVSALDGLESLTSPSAGSSVPAISLTAAPPVSSL